MTALWLAGCAEARPPYQLLFGADESRLAPADQARIFALFSQDFTVSADGTRLQDANCGDLEPQADVVDLNGDGTFEVFIHWGNTCTSGMAGRSLSLYTRTADGDYQPELGFPALTWEALPAAPGTWPELSFGGPGFCRPVWARAADQYQFRCNIPDTEGGCAGREPLCPMQ